MPSVTSMASTGHFDLRICPFGILPPGSQVVRAPSFGSLHGGTSPSLLPSLGHPCSGMSTSSLPLLGVSISHPALPTCQVDRVSTCNTSRSGQLGLCLHLFGLCCGVTPCLRLAFSGTSCGTISCLHTPLSFAQRTNASGLVAMAFSALLVGSTPVIPSARAGVAPMTGDAPPHSYASMHEGSTFQRSMFTTTPASPRGSGPSRITGMLPNADNTPPASCRSSDCGSGGFQSLG